MLIHQNLKNLINNQEIVENSVVKIQHFTIFILKSIVTKKSIQRKCYIGNVYY